MRWLSLRQPGAGWPWCPAGSPGTTWATSALDSLLPDSPDLTGLKVLGDVDLVLARETTGLVIPGSGRTVAVLGLDDIVVVDTPDALLVTTRARAQDVKALVDLLKATGRADLT